MTMQTTYLLLKIEHSAPIPDLTDKVAGRAYTMDKIEDVTAAIITPEAAHSLEMDSKVDVK